MLAAVLTLAFLAAAPVKVASTGFTGAEVEPARLRAWSEHFVGQLGAGEGLKVVTGEDAAAIFWGTAARTGMGFSLTVRVVDASSERAVFVEALDAADEAGVLDALTGSARRAREALGVDAPGADSPVLKRPSLPVGAVTATASASPQDWRPFVLMGGGLVAVAGSAVFFVQAVQKQGALDEIERRSDLAGNTELVAQARTLASKGETLLGVAWAVAGAGAAMIIGGAVWAAWAESSTTAVAVIPTPGGAAVSVGGTFP